MLQHTAVLRVLHLALLLLLLRCCCGCCCVCLLLLLLLLHPTACERADCHTSTVPIAATAEAPAHPGCPSYAHQNIIHPLSLAATLSLAFSSSLLLLLVPFPRLLRFS